MQINPLAPCTMEFSNDPSHPKASEERRGRCGRRGPIQAAVHPVVDENRPNVKRTQRHEDSVATKKRKLEAGGAERFCPIQTGGAKRVLPRMSLSKLQAAVAEAEAIAGSSGDLSLMSTDAHKSRCSSVAKMLEKATSVAAQVGELDGPVAPPPAPGGHRRYQRRNSFVIHKNRSTSVPAMFSCADATPAVGKDLNSTDNATFPEVENGKKAPLGLSPKESALVFRRMSLPWAAAAAARMSTSAVCLKGQPPAPFNLRTEGGAEDTA